MVYAVLSGCCFSVLAYCIGMMIAVKLRADKLVMQKRIKKLQSNPKKQEKAFPEKKIPDSHFHGAKISRISGRLRKELSLAGIPLRAEEFLIIWLFLGVILPAFILVICSNIYVTAAIVLIGLMFPPLLTIRFKKRRLKLFETQLSEALITISNSLRAGFTFQQALESIVNEMPEPISFEFAKTVREIRAGVSMDSSLQNMVKRLHSDDLDLLVSAVVIQRQIGGDLAEILDNISFTIKERQKIRSQIRVLTASGRTSGLIIGLLPIFILIFLMVFNSSYVNLLFTNPIGIAMLCVGALLEGIGFFIVNKIVNIKF